ncbi:MAG: oxaloacetate decarboxylase gamma subunit [Bermanella sp.]|jgi:oxaloacetate decarboxylase gamma subunit
MSSTLFEQGLELMVYGMSTVIVFLSLLVAVTGLMSSVAQKFERPDAPVSKRSGQAGVVTAGSATALTPSVPPTIMAAITAAVHEHRTPPL